ncbi:MAG: hypothetical protein N3D11_02495 [Candidatus Sumerlaeia bacterium]|nr:hypothetical protein [Candidatus Sumerlaeia bacterium]
MKKKGQRRIVIAAVALAGAGWFTVSCTLIRLGERALVGRPELPVSFTQARVRVSYSLRHGTFKVSRLFNSISLSKMATALTLGDRTYSSSDTRCVNVKIRRDALRMIIRSSFPDGPSWDTQFEIRIHPNEGNPALDTRLREAYGVCITCRLTTAAQTAARPVFMLTGLVHTEKEAMACCLGSLSPEKTSGPSDSSDPSAFLDPKRRDVLHLSAQRVRVGPAQNHAGGKRFPVCLEFGSRAGLDFLEKIELEKQSD